MVSAVSGFFYRGIVKPYLFLFDPESVHDSMVSLGESLGAHKASRRLFSALFRYENKALNQNICGIDFANPIGLAGGFDKNGRLTDIIPSLGFGFEEVGSITFKAALGNPKPRLYRLPKSKGIVVNYGLPNRGVNEIMDRLSGKTFSIPIGINIAKTNSPDTVGTERGILDYKGCFEKVVNSRAGDYITINISCPNAYGGEPFTNEKDLDLLLDSISKVPNSKPIFVKMPADISENELETLIRPCIRHSVGGIILTNLTKDRGSKRIDKNEIKEAIPNGGISGKPVFEKSNELIAYAFKNFGDKLAIIGCGGVFSTEDAYKKIRLGASLVQLITGMIFMGPQLVVDINRGLSRLLHRDGFANIKDAVGADVK